MIKLLAFISFTLTLALGNKHNPQWPKYFSAHYEEHQASGAQDHGNDLRLVGEWYFDEGSAFERFDLRYNDTVDVEINDYTLLRKIVLSYSRHRGTAQAGPTCTVSPINGPMPIPQFGEYVLNQTFTTPDGVPAQEWLFNRSATGRQTRYICRDDRDQLPLSLAELYNGEVVFEYRLRGVDYTKQFTKMFDQDYIAPGACKTALEEFEAAQQRPDELSQTEFLAAYKKMRNAMTKIQLNTTDNEPGCSPISCDAMKGIVEKYFPSAYRNDMLCIAHYESSYCPKVFNGSCCYGLWQVNRNHLGETDCPSSIGGLETEDGNAKCAAHILDTQGLDAWTTWTNGDCRHGYSCHL